MDPNPQDPGWVHEDGDHTTRSVVRGLSLVPGVAQLQRCWLWDNSSMLVPTTRGLDPQGPCAVLATTRSPGCEVEVEESTTNHEQTSAGCLSLSWYGGQDHTPTELCTGQEPEPMTMHVVHILMVT